ncbi:cellulose binding domain-containing protein [Streptomyces cyaneofuscatus]|uniref:cellulose binding domain-containing protein n=1 Tax=Streptomyces cyaneofuscatus TaxID=66883 RepID=UPI00344819F3
MSQSLAPGSAARRSVIVASRPVPDIGRRLWDTDEPGPATTYAELCTSTPDAARELAAQAAEQPTAPSWGESSGADELPTVPAALNAVLGKALELSFFPGGCSWLSPELLNQVKESGAYPPSWRSPTGSLALRSLCAMDPSDSELLWWSCVEGLPDPVVAGRLGLSLADVSSDIVRVRADFREQSWLIHRLQLEDPTCLSYAGLLDATARQSVRSTPPDLLEHLGGCSVCAGAFECLSVANVRLPGVIADAALFWNGSAYAARRRGQLSRGSAGATQPPSGSPSHVRRGRGIPLGRHPALKVTAAGVGLVLLLGGVLSLSTDDAPSPQDDQRSLSTVQPGAVESGSVSGGTEAASRQPGKAERSAPVSEKKVSASPSPGSSGEASAGPSDEASAGPSDEASAGPPPAEEGGKPEPPPPPSCSATLDVRKQWNEGIETDLDITPRTAPGEDWRVTFRVPDGTRVEVWNGHVTTEGSIVTVKAASYNAKVPDGGTLTIGVVVAFDRDPYTPAAWISDVRLNSGSCPL